MEVESKKYNQKAISKVNNFVKDFYIVKTFIAINIELF